MKNQSNRGKWTSKNRFARIRFAAEREKIQNEAPTKRRVMELTLTRRIIDQKFLEMEPAGAKTRWVAYGYMSPLECTELFCRLYLETYRRYYEKYKDYLTAQDQNPIDPELLKNDTSEISALWHARLHADAIGMPYEQYLSAVMEWATNRANRKHFPRPNQLIRKEQLLAANEKWDRERDAASIFDERWDDRLFQQNPVLDPPRKMALQLGLGRIMKSSNQEYALAALMGVKDALSERLARRLFRDRPSLVDDALRYIKQPLKVRSATTFEPYRPPCLGITRDFADDACSTCAFKDACVKSRSISDALLIIQTGSADPRAEKKRAQNRERQRRKRDKDRTARGELEKVMATP